MQDSLGCSEAGLTCWQEAWWWWVWFFFWVVDCEESVETNHRSGIRTAGPGEEKPWSAPTDPANGCICWIHYLVALLCHVAECVEMRTQMLWCQEAEFTTPEIFSPFTDRTTWTMHYLWSYSHKCHLKLYSAKQKPCFNHLGCVSHKHVLWSQEPVYWIYFGTTGNLEI